MIAPVCGLLVVLLGAVTESPRLRAPDVPLRVGEVFELEVAAPESLEAPPAGGEYGDFCLVGSSRREGVVVLRLVPLAPGEARLEGLVLEGPGGRRFEAEPLVVEVESAFAPGRPKELETDLPVLDPPGREGRGFRFWGPMGALVAAFFLLARLLRGGEAAAPAATAPPEGSERSLADALERLAEEAARDPGAALAHADDLLHAWLARRMGDRVKHYAARERLALLRRLAGGARPEALERLVEDAERLKYAGVGFEPAAVSARLLAAARDARAWEVGR